MSSSSGVFDFIRKQSPLFVNKLYGDQEGEGDVSQATWVCRGVLQSLCPLAKCFVMRLLFIDAPISSVDIFQWCEPDKKQEHDSAISELRQLRIFVDVEAPERSQAQRGELWFVLNKPFRESIKRSLVASTQPWEAPRTAVKTEDNQLDAPTPMIQDDLNEGVARKEEAAPSESELESYSCSRWNTVLQFLVTADLSLQVSPRVISYLLAAGLMQNLDEDGQGPPQKRLKSGRSRGKLSITASGYEYMLLDIQSQVWLFVLECLKTATDSQVDLLGLIFMLSFCTVGEGYPLAQLTAPQKLLLEDLVEMGLVYIPPSRQLFYPTRITINMLHIAPDLSAATSGGRVTRDNAMQSMSLTIIVETNFQVVAYVNSDLHLAMLSLFVDTRTMIRLPNMVMGNITRDSAKAAFRLGISAKQIIGFLVTHAHPLSMQSSPIIPENVSDQLKLWQAEKKRFVCQPALVVDLHDVAQGPYLVTLYDKLVAYARDLQVLVWANARLREFGVTPEGFPRVQAYAATLDAPH
eukprot:CAMPEP_0114441746 /NCGR_PEP_ID=MMETSP0103-20121206/16547_1 /TAXON_ID=37642 ORGANISM="Paraphysomonas imperforata, Strain PA2" /NCGR_SAMPLE_ID=MMETSP0103 /ASSEMBLY_ACC=CAM_ASM_000201 /LENGTH=521 /DNA_ID=CAMNT_0001612897 /DNA_START=50 /DNA_END=1615 /DNA_ORIENTATION=-